MRSTTRLIVVLSLSYHVLGDQNSGIVGIGSEHYIGGM